MLCSSKECPPAADKPHTLLPQCPTIIAVLMVYKVLLRRTGGNEKHIPVRRTVCVYELSENVRKPGIAGL